MAYTEVTRNSYGSRIGKSLKGFVIGLLLIPLSIFILWANEGRSIDRYKALTQAEGDVVAVDAETLDSNLDGALIYVSGNLETSDLLTDSLTGISTSDMKLLRKVEMYQWKETKKISSQDNLGGSETVETTYTYSKVWSEDRIDSGRFKQEGHENPSSLPYTSQDFVSSSIMLGEYSLDSIFVNQLTQTESLGLTQDDLLIARSGSLSSARLDSDSFYIGQGSMVSPNIGDVRISYRVAPVSEVTLVGKQSGSSISEYLGRKDNSIALLKYGILSQEEIFDAAQRDNRILTWVLRGLGLFLMFVGFSMIFGILVIVAKVVPFISRIISFGTSLIAFVLTLVFGGMTIIISWILVRPLVAIGVLVLVVGAIFGVLHFKKAYHKTDSVSSTPEDIS